MEKSINIKPFEEDGKNGEHVLATGTPGCPPPWSSTAEGPSQTR